MSEYINVSDSALVLRAMDCLGTRSQYALQHALDYTASFNSVAEGKTKLKGPIREKMEQFVRVHEAVAFAHDVEERRVDFVDSLCKKATPLRGYKFLIHLIGCKVCLAQVLVEKEKLD